jgi:phosphonate transport system permease protein
LLIIYDAFVVAKIAGDPVKTRPFLVFAALLLTFFVIGWQIGEINLFQLVRDFDQVLPTFGHVLWPWANAIDYPEDIQLGTTQVQAPCDDSLAFSPEDPPADGPYLETDPQCGDMSEQDGASGTVLAVNGYGFLPDTEVDIWWKDPVGQEFRQRQEGDYVKVFPDENGEFEVTITMPYRLLPPSQGEGAKVWELQGRQLVSVGDWVFSEELGMIIVRMIETIFIGMMATFFGILLALPLSFMAAKNLMSANWLTLIVYYVVRFIMNIIRSIEPLIWAVLALIAVGLGPFAGIVALTVHTAAALGKLYSESIESIDPGPIEAVQATGANWFQVVAYAVIPQIIPPFVSFTIYRWDINIRMSTIIGMVGGGGIGFLLVQWLRLLDYRSAGMAVWFIAVTVSILDYVSAEIRERFV